MGRFMEECKAKVVQIAADVTSKFAGSSIRVAFVGYTDHCETQPYPFCDFTDAARLRDYIALQQPTGGGDTCEDVAGGLRRVLGLKFRSPCARVMVHLCDAPAHGKMYHNLGPEHDHHMAIPEADTLEPLAAKLAKKKVDYYFLRLTEHTDIMVEAMRRAYDAVTEKNSPLAVIIMGSDVASFLNTVTECVTASMASFGF